MMYFIFKSKIFSYNKTPREIFDFSRVIFVDSKNCEPRHLYNTIHIYNVVGYVRYIILVDIICRLMT